jgi:hypothetical protein
VSRYIQVTLSRGAIASTVNTMHVLVRVELWAEVFRTNHSEAFGMSGGDDGTRTRDLCRDRLPANVSGKTADAHLVNYVPTMGSKC